MANQSIIINFALPTNVDGSSDDSSNDGSGGTDDRYSSDWLKLSQQPYEEKSMTDFDQWLIDQDAGYAVETLPQQMEVFKSVCEEETGDLKVTIRVQKSRSDLGYSIKASYGTLSVPSITELDVEESYSVSGESSVDLNIIVSDGTTASWEGDVVDSSGNFIAPKPEITVENNVASFGQEVTGTFRLSGGTAVDEYVLTIHPRVAGFYDATKPETSYQSTISAVWGGGVETLVVEMPEMIGNCLEIVWGGNVVIDPDDDDDDDDDEECIRLIEVRNPCTGELISTREESIPCPTQEEAIDADLEEFFG